MLLPGNADLLQYDTCVSFIWDRECRTGFHKYTWQMSARHDRLTLTHALSGSGLTSPSFSCWSSVAALSLLQGSQRVLGAAEGYSSVGLLTEYLLPHCHAILQCELLNTVSSQESFCV